MDQQQIIQSSHLPTAYSSQILTMTRDLGEFIVKIKSLKELATQFQSDIEATRNRDSGNELMLGFIGHALLGEIPTGLRKYARQIGSKQLDIASQNREQAIDKEVNALLDICSNLLKDDFVSHAIPNKLLNGWNTGLGNIRGRTKPDTKLKNCISFLDTVGLSVQQIISKGYIRAEPRPNAIIAKLSKKHERIHEMISSAEKKVNKGRTEEDFCHALLSCRRALETLIYDMTGQGRFGEGLAMIPLSDTKKKIVRNAYDFLSGYGVHPNKITTKEDMETGYQLSLSAISVLMQYEDDQK